MPSDKLGITGEKTDFELDLGSQDPMRKSESSCTKHVMKRRDFVAGLVAAGAARPAWEQREGMRRVGVLTGLAEDDPPTKARFGAFREGMAALGWAEGRNFRINAHFAPGASGTAATLVTELLALKPDVLLV